MPGRRPRQQQTATTAKRRYRRPKNHGGAGPAKRYSNRRKQPARHFPQNRPTRQLLRKYPSQYNSPSSRSVIPYIRGAEQSEWSSRHTYLKHIGIYGYRSDILHEITRLPQGMLEKAESLEQLRWLENGYRIKVGLVSSETIGIDTPEDLARLLKKMHD